MALLRLEDFKVPMRMVFRLEEELQRNPDRVRLSQALTLNTSKPEMGLKGTNGLFGSPQWWASIREGRMPLLYRTGIVQRAYVAGQDSRAFNDTIDMKQNDGSVEMTGIYVNRPDDAALFLPGCQIAIVYARDELKAQPAADGGVNCSNIALEMAVSVDR